MHVIFMKIKTILVILIRNHSHVRLIISLGIIYICLAILKLLFRGALICLKKSLSTKTLKHQFYNFNNYGSIHF